MSSKQTTQPEMLDLGDTSGHPMWTPPGDGEVLDIGTRALRKEIARRLVPYDGRKESGVSYDLPLVVRYFKDVYLTSQRPEAASFIWLLGAVTLVTLQSVDTIQIRLVGMESEWRENASSQPTRQRLSDLRRQRNVIEQQAQFLIAAMYQSVV